MENKDKWNLGNVDGSDEIPASLLDSKRRASASAKWFIPRAESVLKGLAAITGRKGGTIKATEELAQYIGLGIVLEDLIAVRMAEAEKESLEEGMSPVDIKLTRQIVVAQVIKELVESADEIKRM